MRSAAGCERSVAVKLKTPFYSTPAAIPQLLNVDGCAGIARAMASQWPVATANCAAKARW